MNYDKPRIENGAEAGNSGEPLYLSAEDKETAVGPLGFECFESLSLREFVLGQAEASYKGYQSLVGQLSDFDKRATVVSKDIFASDLERALMDRILSPNFLDYINSQKNDHPGLRFNLIASPNVPLSWTALKPAVSAYQKKHPAYSIMCPESIIEQYSPKQISGSNESGYQVNYQLMPSGIDLSLHGTVVEQRLKLAEKQRLYPFLAVPSVLDNVVNWYTLDAHGFGDLSHNLAHVRHFDLPILSDHKSYDKAVIACSFAGYLKEDIWNGIYADVPSNARIVIKLN